MILELEACGDTHKRIIIGGRPLAYKYHEGKMKRTLERELNSMRKCWWKADQTNGHFFKTLTSNVYSKTRYKLSGWLLKMRGTDASIYSDPTRLETRTKESSISASI